GEALVVVALAVGHCLEEGQPSLIGRQNVLERRTPPGYGGPEFCTAVHLGECIDEGHLPRGGQVSAAPGFVDTESSVPELIASDSQVRIWVYALRRASRTASCRSCLCWASKC